MSSKISRGDFLKRSGLAAAGIMMGGVANSSELFAAQQDKKERFGNMELKIAGTAAAFLGRQMEQ